MGSNIYSIAGSALQAAQVGIATTGHNIANASTPGYNRQVVVQASNAAQQYSFGFVGQGTQVASVKRIYDQFLAQQVNTATSSKNMLDTYSTQITQIANLVADSSAGLSPAVNDFFSAFTTTSSFNRTDIVSKAQTLASRFQSLQGRLDEIGAGVNGQITSTITTINGYAQGLAQLNDSIQKAESGTSGGPPNDLLDQRDQLITQLSTLTKVNVVQQGSAYNVTIGTGQPLVLGSSAYTLQATTSPTDPQRVEIAYATPNGGSVLLGENSLQGGSLGGLLAFRANTLDAAQNQLGRVAIGLASQFNDQNKLGLDLNGAPGGNIFNVAAPSVAIDSNNTGSGQLAATFAPNTGPNTGVAALTGSDYSVRYDGTNYKITRLSDGVSQSTNTPVTTLPLTMDGVVFNLSSGTPNAGDSFLVRPTANGASSFSVTATDPAKIAAAAPISTSIPSTNTGTGKISEGVVNSSFVQGSVVAGSPLQFSYNAATNKLVPNATLTALGQPVTVTINGTATTYAAGVNVPYSSGATYSFGGMSVNLSGTPNDTDVFNVALNTNTVGDLRNSNLLGGLQAQKGLLGGTASYTDAYSQMVAQIGNKTAELQVTGAAQTTLLTQAQQSQQSQSGVNLDEEATNLLRYQQTYQAAGKVMQIASQMFQTLLSIGG
ncbi:flagellar hook-associated protein FlgK [Undibacterium sp.]|jgi:flagellar hook-associated protein 1 FlgK|uniref:flagellar hook-associated protein FlgK n=1 Tax=Undibacterium sp. TaxID=1914977 RepID=UPI002CF57581|nr:flagellar hook-associated protein FlgK [Undibacterium sp.]HTD05386.1 flagellar hook-associated protein FlgK [Undibacterium sp.]